MACPGGVCPINKRQNNMMPMNAAQQMPMQQYQQYPMQQMPQQQNNSGGFWNGVKSFFVGTPGGVEQNSRFTGGQNQLLNNIANIGQSQLPILQANPLGALMQLQQQGYQPSDTQPLINKTLGSLQSNQYSFGPISQKYQTQFQQQTIPSILERLTSMGGQRSNALGQTLGQAGAGLAENLAALESQYALANKSADTSLLSSLLTNRLGSQGQELNLADTLGRLGIGYQNSLQNLLSLGLTPSFENTYFAGQPGVLQTGAQKASDIATKLVGAYLGMV